MPVPQIETAAQRYRRIKAEKEKGESLYDVPCQCGMTWKARKFQLEFWVTSGILPMHLVEPMVEALGENHNAAEDAIKKMATKEVLESIVFASKVVRHTAADPVIKEKPEGPNDISQEEVETCCYTTLLNWQMKGGEQASGLGKFPQG